MVSLSSLPLSWHERLRHEFPWTDLVEMGPEIEKMRYIKGEEEIELAQRSAQAADKGFNEVLTFLKPGMREFDALSLLERAMKAEGGDDFFDLIFSGPFEPGVKLAPFAITGRKEPSRMIQAGDSVLLEITPRYGGYWSQLVRVINVGRENRAPCQVPSRSPGWNRSCNSLLQTGYQAGAVHSRGKEGDRIGRPRASFSHGPYLRFEPRRIQG